MSARLALPVTVVGLGLAGLIAAPTAAATCNASSGTVICGQGDIRGTDAPPPARGALGAFGTFCSGGSCYLGRAGLNPYGIP